MSNDDRRRREQYYALRHTLRDGIARARHDPLELLTLDEVSALIKRSRRSLTEDIAAGRLRAVKLGRSTRVPRLELERYLAEMGGYPVDVTDIEEARRDH
jgi:excisionase family DNA binding protein